jgi:hypothetical protein
MPSKFQTTREFVELTIANGGTTSTAYELNGTCLDYVIIPSAFTGDTLTIEYSIDGTNFYKLYGHAEGDAKAIKVEIGKCIWVERWGEAFRREPFNFIRLVSSSVEAGERIIKIICNP